MDRSLLANSTSTNTNEYSSTNKVKSELNPSTANSRSIRDMDEEVQSLKRENFNLKLRIYFLEEQQDSDIKNPSILLNEGNENPAAHKIGDQKESTVQIRDRNRTGQQGYSSGGVSTIGNTNDQQTLHDDETHALTDELVRTRQENEALRQLLHDSNGSNRQRKITSTNNIESDRLTNRSELVTDSNMPGSLTTSHINRSDVTVQNRNSYTYTQREVQTLESKLVQTSQQLTDLQKQYEIEREHHQKQQAENDRLINNMRVEHNQHINELKANYEEKLATFESYRHEPLLARIRFSYPLQDQNAASGNNSDQQRTILKLENTIQELLKFDRAPIISEPTSPISSEYNQENFQRLRERVDFYVKLNDRLRLEANQLQKHETYLAAQVEVLKENINTLISPDDPPKAKVRSMSSQNGRSEEVLKGPQEAIPSVVGKIYSTAERIHNVTEEVSSFRRKYQQVTQTVKQQEEEIRKYQSYEADIDYRLKQRYGTTIETLKRETQPNPSRDSNNTSNSISVHSSYARNMENNYIQELEKLQEEIQALNKTIQHLESKLHEEQRTVEAVRAEYAHKKNLDSRKIEELENVLREQDTEINRNRVRADEMQRALEKRQHEFDQQREVDMQEINRMKSERTNFERQLHKLRDQSEQAEEQRGALESQIQIFKNQIEQHIQERRALEQELEAVKQENRVAEDRLHINTKEMNKQKEQYDIIVNRLQDREDESKRYQNEFNKLQQACETARTKYQNAARESNEWKSQYEATVTDLTAANKRRQLVEEELQITKNDYAQLKYDLDNLEIRVRLEINEEFENEFRTRFDQLSGATAEEVQNIEKEKSIIEENIKKQQIQIENLQSKLQETNKILENRENEINRLRQDLQNSQNKNEQIEYQISQKYRNEISIHIDRIKELERATQSYEVQLNQIDQLQQEVRDKDNFIQRLENDRVLAQADFDNQAQRLEKDCEIKERLITAHIETIKVKDQQIELLLSNIKPADSSSKSTLESIQKEFEKANRRLSDTFKDQFSNRQDQERQLNELTLNIQDYQRQLAYANEQLQETDQIIDKQKRDISNLEINFADLTGELSVAREQNLHQSDRIAILERELEMIKNLPNTSPSEQRHQYETMIADLKLQIQQREKPIQDYQKKLRASRDELSKSIQVQNNIQSDYNQIIRSTDTMQRQHTAELETFDKKISILQQKLSDKDREVLKLQGINVDNERKIAELHAEFIKIDPNYHQSYPGERQPSVASLQSEIQQRDRKISELERTIDEYEQRLRQNGGSSSLYIPAGFKLDSDLDSLSREELVQELKSAKKVIQEFNDSKRKISLNKRDSGVSSSADIIDTQRQISERDEQIDKLTIELNNLRKTHESINHQHRIECEQVRQQLTADVQRVQNDLQQAHEHIGSLEALKVRFGQADTENRRLHAEIKRLETELERSSKISNISDRALKSSGDTTEISIGRSDLANLLEQIRLLRHDLNLSIQRQKELQERLDENIRQSRSPREFTFSGRGVSYPDLRVIDASGVVGGESISIRSVVDEKRSRPIGSSSTEFEHIEYGQNSMNESEGRIPTRLYIVGDKKAHDDLRRIISSVRRDLRAFWLNISEHLRSKNNASSIDVTIRTSAERVNALEADLTTILDIIQSFWDAELPERSQTGEHYFVDYRLLEENRHLLSIQAKYIQHIEHLKKKCKEQATYLDQLLAQLKSNQL